EAAKTGLPPPYGNIKKLTWGFSETIADRGTRTLKSLRHQLSRAFDRISFPHWLPFIDKILALLVCVWN
ncbi:MAG: hypothetical protein ACKO2T_14365, partial [Microcystis aeruginosa]